MNLLLGIIVLLFPLGIDRILGLPEVANYFYTTILSAVLVGIAIALYIEAYSGHKGFRGLGLYGAIAINLCGGIALVLWLIFGTLSIPAQGRVILWLVAILVIAIGFAE